MREVSDDDGIIINISLGELRICCFLWFGGKGWSVDIHVKTCIELRLVRRVCLWKEG